MNADIAATLVAVAKVMTGAQEPWWVIGSAAVALYAGVDVGANDIDVMLSVGDAEALAGRLSLDFSCREDSELFRSARFLEWRDAAMPVEFMAGFEVKAGNDWRQVCFTTRETMTVSGASVFVPGGTELRDLLLAFGREKDLAHAALL